MDKSTNSCTSMMPAPWQEDLYNEARERYCLKTNKQKQVSSVAETQTAVTAQSGQRGE